MTDGQDPRPDFWDTNLVVGYTVDWDRYGPPVEAYLRARGDERETVASTRAFDEAEAVVETQRRRVRQAADRVFEAFDAGRHDSVTDVKGFVHAEFGDDWAKVSPVLDYIDHHDGAFLGLTETDESRALRATFEEIRGDFRAASDSVARLRRDGGAVDLGQFEDGLDDYADTYETAHRRLDALLDDTDRDLLLDAHHAVNVTARPRLAFVTFDYGDIVDSAAEIESCLSGVTVVGGRQFT